MAVILSDQLAVILQGVECQDSERMGSQALLTFSLITTLPTRSYSLQGLNKSLWREVFLDEG